MIAMAACRLTTEPNLSFLRGTYVLETVDGRRLPADLSGDASIQLTLFADTMRFDGIGGTVQLSTMSVRVSGTEPVVRQYSSPMTYEIRGSSVRFGIFCPIDADCAAPPIGQIVSKYLLIVRQGTRASVYRRT
jgi:hypothetical protein